MNIEKEERKMRRIDLSATYLTHYEKANNQTRRYKARMLITYILYLYRDNIRSYDNYGIFAEKLS